jgi:hypothetical protein
MSGTNVLRQLVVLRLEEIGATLCPHLKPYTIAPKCDLKGHAGSRMGPYHWLRPMGSIPKYRKSQAAQTFARTDPLVVKPFEYLFRNTVVVEPYGTPPVIP